MFESIRKNTRLMALLLGVVVIPAFVLFGVSGYTSFNERTETVAELKGRTITREVWEQAHQREIDRLRQSLPNLDMAQLDTPAARRVTLERLLDEALLAQAAADLRITLGDARLARLLRQEQAVANLLDASGQLDKDRFRDWLNAQGFTPETFDATMRAQLAPQELPQLVQASTLVTDGLVQPWLKAYFERRVVSARWYPAKDYEAKVKVDDAAIEASYRANVAVYQTPETVDVAWVTLSREALARQVKLEPEALRTYYQQNLASFRTPQERQVRHILLKLDASTPPDQAKQIETKANALLQQLRADPQRFAELAKANSQDPGSAAQGGDLGFFGRGAMVKPFEDAAFALAPNGISDVVRTDFGLHILQLVAERGGQTQTFEQARGEIEKRFRQQQAQRLYAEQAERLTNLAFEQPDTLDPVVKSLGLTLQRVTNVTRQKVPEALNQPRLVQALFAADATQKKLNTEALEVSPGVLVSARVTHHQAPATRPLDEVREQVKRQLVAEQGAQMAIAAGVQALEAARKGQAPTGLSAPLTVSRDQSVGLPVEAVRAVMGADARELPVWVGVPAGAQGYWVARIDQVKARQPVDPTQQAQEKTQLQRWLAQAEWQALLEALRKRYDARVVAS
jgi:peptidyl-prolyl cis-trans isomerase D